MLPDCTSWAVLALPWYSLNFISQGIGYRGSRAYYTFQCWTSTMQRFNRWLMRLIKLQLSGNTSFLYHFPSAQSNKAALHSCQCYMMRSLFSTYPLAWNKEEWPKETLSQGLEWTCWGTFWCTTCARFAEPVGIGCCPARKGVRSTRFPNYTGIKLPTWASWNLPLESYLSLQF